MLFNSSISSINTVGNAQSGKDPQKVQMAETLRSYGIPDSVIKQGPSAVQSYAVQNGIQLPGQSSTSQQTIGADALFTMKPQGPQGGGKEAFEAQLVSAGVPASVVAQGKTAVESYALQNGITLPEPPAKPAQGSKLNVMS